MKQYSGFVGKGLRDIKKAEQVELNSIVEICEQFPK